MTEEQYRENVLARFGTLNWAKLAARENAASRRNWERSMPSFAGVKPAEVRARRLTWGTLNHKGGGDDANMLRQRQAIAEREELAARALVLITERRRMKAEMLEALDTTENRLRQALQLLRDAGKVAVKREGAAAWWAAE